MKTNKLFYTELVLNDTVKFNFNNSIKRKKKRLNINRFLFFNNA